MTEEINYRFIRGTGWIPDVRNYEWASRIIGGFHVTVEIRKPEVGERYWSIKKDTCEELLEYIEKDHDGYLSDEDPPGALNTEDQTPVSIWSGTARFAVVKVVKL